MTRMPWVSHFGFTPHAVLESERRIVPRFRRAPSSRSALLIARTRFSVSGFRWSTGRRPFQAIMCSYNLRVGCGERSR